MKTLLLQDNWFIQTSSELSVHGETISSPNCPKEGWQPALVPGTVFGALVKNKVYPNPYYSDNLTRCPGYKPQKDQVISNVPMPDNSPFRKPWWYRTEFIAPLLGQGQKLWLRFKGINYSANVWVNGKRAAGPDLLTGMFRIYELDVTRLIKPGETAVLAVEVFAQNPDDLGLSFIDWCPVPPDDSMGLLQPVEYFITGPVRIKSAVVSTKLNAKFGDIALRLEIQNMTDKPVQGTIQGKIEAVSFSHPFELESFSSQQLILNTKTTPELRIPSPRIWWPYQMGTPELYRLQIQINLQSELSDSREITFGIREITSRITDKGVRIFTVNGRDILIRGGAWTPDLMLNHSKRRVQDDIRYLKNLHFNAIRIEGTLTPDDLWDECDKEGILVFTGLPASSHWEHWADWKEGDLDTAVKGLRSEVERIGSRACLSAFMYGSDFPPPENVEQAYCDVLERVIPDITQIASASAIPSGLQAVSGVKMTGPYSFVPPEYWYNKDAKGHAFGFNTEAGPDIGIPPIESLRKMFAPQDLVVDGPVWKHHAGLVFFADTKPTDEAITHRFGKPSDIDDYARFAQVLGYECWRSLYEAHNREFPSATGIIAWKMNSPWPRLIWQLYDYYLNPLGNFFGAQKACEPIHAQYSYDDRTLWVINNTSGRQRLNLTATLTDLNGKTLLENKVAVNCPAWDKVSVFALPRPSTLSPVYFLTLCLWENETRISRNCYYFSAQRDISGPEDPKFFALRPMVQYADFSALPSLPKNPALAEWQISSAGDKTILRGRLKNPTDQISFFNWIKVWDTITNDYLLPVFWSENCITLLPHETLDVTGYYLNDVKKGEPEIKIIGWNT